ncbi:MAG: NADP-dependent phosphogluconate dehydrogenase [Bacteroidota bacterium]
MSAHYDFGMIGLGVMGRNFLLNVADNGFAAVGLDKDDEKARLLEEEGRAGGKTIKGATETQEFVAALAKPRKIMMLVPAGKIVDIVIEDLLPHLEAGDLVIDGGNSFYTDTDRREQYLKEKGIHFLGVGVSGGAKGARFGPSIMPGGKEAAYEIVRPVLEAVSAKVKGEPCVAYLGKSSSGNYVKMVHNGIEYALMQLLAESYDLLKRIGGLSNEELHETYAKWNKGRLQSFLVEITAAIFKQADDVKEGDLIDAILDKAKQKGTGKWTSQNGMDLGIPVPSIDSAVSMRGLSSLKTERIAAAEFLDIKMDTTKVDQAKFVAQVEAALYFAFIVTYAQGMSLLAAASEEYDYELNMEEIAKIWRGGCIIRAELLELMRQAYAADPKLKNLLVADSFKSTLQTTHTATRDVLKIGIESGIPLLTFGSALGYFDAYRSARLPLNLVQAQRDYFGSHTYERIDQAGSFHTEW